MSRTYIVTCMILYEACQLVTFLSIVKKKSNKDKYINFNKYGMTSLIQQNYVS